MFCCGSPDVSDFERRKRARYRDTEHSSSDSSDAGAFLISNVKFRVGAPPPQPLPVFNGWSTACTLVQEALGTSLQGQAEIIAKAEGVEPLSVELVGRFVTESDSCRPTILIVAKWSEASPPIWEKIVRNTKKFVDLSTRDGDLEDIVISVEMIAEELTLTKNPLTVYISVDYESEESKWPPVVGEIQQLLNGYGHNLYLAKNDKNEPVPLDPVKDSDLWKVDLKGMGPNLASEKAEVEHPTRAKHCFAVQVLTEEIEKNPNDPDTPKSAEHLNNIKGFFDNNEQHLGSIYCASGYTHRTANDGRLDWALIKPTGAGVARIGKNPLPTRADWHKKWYITSKPRARGVLKQPPNRSLRSIPNGDPIFKLGTTTGATGGVFSWLKPKVNFAEDAHVQAYMDARHRPYLSNEFLYIGYPNPAEHWLAKKGDSGSVVFDTDGRAVGLLSRGHMAQQAASSPPYITPPHRGCL
ncbi:hypothetical protein B0T26DRAFT_674734 [Lasiosphaeria miniovina]|uniref:Uncharacterized protein n=1 Tax=Lasiosphaeria miniovina TaxID=1954250 RepID=A0AA40AW42_9PEZI|nr:uncharacterized protein B0T26DRAFT_674734 [Lasiosphaeria miniovina]KAK0723122.1 hypothetical protein B0T26DRAFT_674734 [Lasiosphaeria miniovina]